MALDWVVSCLKRAVDTPTLDPGPPGQKAYDDALAMVEAMRKDRDRWSDEAAMKAREVLSLRIERDRAWADVEAAQRRIAYLESQRDRLAAEVAELRGEAGRMAGRSATAGRAIDGSWSGFVEGG